MNVVVSSRSRLRERYGDTGLAAVEAALDELELARGAAGVPSLRYMVEDGLPPLGVPGAPVEWQAIAAQLGTIAQRLISGGDRLESVLLIGGPQVVPFGVLANPVQDRDPALPVDCVYGSSAVSLPLLADEEGLATSIYGIDWPVGRLPDADEPTPDLLVRLIGAAAAQHGRGPLPLVPALCYSTASWQVATESICAEVNSLAPAGGALRLILSPPSSAERLDRESFGQARLIYCNLHGLIDAPDWYGQPVGDFSLLPALRPEDVADLDLTGAVLVTAACYGAAIERATLDSSLALMVLSRGAATFIGATVITYGPLQPPSSEADLLVLHLLRRLYSRAGSVGEAFLQARIGMLRETLLLRGYLDDDDAKTLLGFVLYGDPTLRIADDRAPRPPTAGRSAPGGGRP